MSVRDYELDLEAIVNNAVYMNYLEHARHEYLRDCGLSFEALTRAGVYLVVTRVEMDYLSPLRSGDRFTIGVRVEQVSRVRWGFQQEIRRDPGGELVLKSRLIVAGMNAEGSPRLPREVIDMLSDRLVRP
jgi:acyl-CoA thioester hydrolase